MMLLCLARYIPLRLNKHSGYNHTILTSSKQPKAHGFYRGLYLAAKIKYLYTFVSLAQKWIEQG